VWGGRPPEPAPSGPQQLVGFSYQGRELTAPRGATIAAALLANGITSWRLTRGHGRPRGLFCGIGHCYDCLVDVGESQAVRACQVPVRDGDEVRQAGPVGGGPAADRPAGGAAGQAGSADPADQAGAADPPGQGGSAHAADLAGPADLSAQAGATGPPYQRGPAHPAGQAGAADSARQAAGVLRTEVAVIGAGPAGMAAALAAADAGCAVTLVDPAPQIGGQIYRQDQRLAAGAGAPPPVTGGLPERFHRAAAHPRIGLLPGTSVWHAQRAGPRFLLQCAGQVTGAIDAAAVVLATGAAEVVFPFPGWTLPGVVTAGAAQALIKAQGTLVGRRVLVAGSGPLLLPAAVSLARHGARVVAVCEAARPARLLSRAPGLAGHPAKVREAAGYAAALARHRIPVWPGRAVIACEGERQLERAVVARVDAAGRQAGPPRAVSVDAVAVSMGFAPVLELARALGCDCRPQPHRPAVVTVTVTQDQAASTPGVFGCGEVTGVGGAGLAEAEGTVAGAAAARLLGRLNEPRYRQRLAGPLRQVARLRRFAAWLDGTYPVTDGWLDLLRPDTVMCRCEEVTWADLAGAFALGAAGLRAVKGITRCGMGYCQGRVCGPGLQHATARQAALPLAEVGDLNTRHIAAPVTVGTLAASAPGSDPGPSSGGREER
jgi:NADPH-dependent 2,4-dienoyl-CoA reductase/sulfur reductase-like enzyme